MLSVPWSRSVLLNSAIVAVLILAQNGPALADPAFPELTGRVRDCGDPAAVPDICRVRSAPSQKAAEALLDGRDLAFERQGSRFTIVARSAEDKLTLQGAISAPMARLPGTDLWALSVEIPGLDEALLDFFLEPSNSRGMAPEWRGPRAEPEPAFRRELEGRVLETSIDSAALGQTRGLTVYLPPHFDAKGRYPVVYIADGQSVAFYSRIVEPAIADGRIRPVVLVGLHNGDNEQRSRDYLLGWKDTNDGFQAHEKFLVSEVMPRAEREWGASTLPAERLVIGKSSGAAWAVATALRNPELFGQAAGISGGWKNFGAGAERPGRPRLFLATGTLDSFIVKTREAAARAQASGDEVVLRTPVSGHGDIHFKALLDDVLIWAFGRPGA